MLHHGERVHDEVRGRRRSRIYTIWISLIISLHLIWRRASKKNTPKGHHREIYSWSQRLKWKVVFKVGGRRYFHAHNPEELQDERRLMYVATTRANEAAHENEPRLAVA